MQNDFSDVGVDQLCCTYNEDFSMIAGGGTDSVVRLYDSGNYSFIKNILGGRDTEGFTSCVTCIQHKPILKPENIDNNFIITCKSQRFKMSCNNECLALPHLLSQMFQKFP